MKTPQWCRSVGTPRTLARGRPAAVAAPRSSTPFGFTDTSGRFPVPDSPFHRETPDEGRERVDRVRSIPAAHLHARSPVTSRSRGMPRIPQAVPRPWQTHAATSPPTPFRSVLRDGSPPVTIHPARILPTAPPDAAGLPPVRARSLHAPSGVGSSSVTRSNVARAHGNSSHRSLSIRYFPAETCCP